MPLNPRLKLAIFTSGTSQTVVARKTGIDESRLSRIINGHAEPTPDEQKVLARALRKPVDELFPGSEAVAS